MKNKIRVGIIGTGKHGSRYAGHLVNDLPDKFVLAGISRRGEAGQKQAAEWQTTCYHDWKALVASDGVDAIISAVPPHINYDIMMCCLVHKKPLLIEKPLTTKYAKALDAVERFAAQSLPLTVAQTLRYNSVILALKEHFPDMGELYSFSSTQRLEPSAVGWLEQPEIAGGGVIFHTAVHMFDAIRFITGLDIVRVRATAKKIYNKNLEDLLCAELELSNGAIGLVDTSKISPTRSGRYEFVCKTGQLQGDQVHGILQRVVGMNITDLVVEPPAPTILPLLNDWYTCLKGGGENPISGTAGLEAVRVCEACQRAVESCDWVTV